MRQYVFFVEGLGLTLTVLSSSARLAYQAVWNNLPDGHKDAVVQIELIDILDLDEEAE